MNTCLNHFVASEEDTRRLAYELWQRAGGPAGRDLEFWNAAQQQLSLLYSECRAFQHNVRQPAKPAYPVHNAEERPVPRRLIPVATALPVTRRRAAASALAAPAGIH